MSAQRAPACPGGARHARRWPRRARQAWRWAGGARIAVRLGLGAAVPVLALGALTGCTGIVVQDDFAVQRTGDGPGANLTLVVNDAGTATCNRAAPVPISGSQLIQARYIQTTIAPQAQQGLTLPAGPRPVFHYAVQTPDGHVNFYDDSKGQPSIFDALALLTLQIAQQDCHLAL